MFRHHGPSRSERQNGILAAYLALIGGFVNSAGFALLGTFTSHVTGNVGRFASDIEAHQLVAAGAALTMVAAFFGGAFLSSLIVESELFERTPTAYGAVLLSEALLLAAFTLFTSYHLSPRLLTRDMLAILLCLAMGMQNSLVTRLSGAVVRTTHLTGVVTDLGIETARWLRWWRARSESREERRTLSGRPTRERPISARIRLHAIIVSTFLAGALLGTVSAIWLQERVMLLPGAAVAAGASYAFLSARHAPLRSASGPRASVNP